MVTAGSRLRSSTRRRFIVPLPTWTFVPLLGFVARPALIPAMALLALSGLGWAHSIGLDQRLLTAAPGARPHPESGHLRPDARHGLGFAAADAAAEFADPQSAIVASGLAGLLAVTLLARPVTASSQQEVRHPSAADQQNHDVRLED